ncbi:MAG TPA: PspC domain-containing protein [Allosphingosinicella sp.]|jgi:phage shock protein PspC (stress-responsive transcriptional regulator)
MASKGNLFFRDDTFFGVCQGLGEDTGVPPTLLRMGFAVMLFWNPLAGAGAYAALGLVVAIARFVFPVPRTGDAAPAAAAAAPVAAEPEAVMASYAADLEPVEAEARAEPVRLAA